MRAVAAVSTQDMTGTPFPFDRRLRHRLGPPDPTDRAPTAEKPHRPKVNLSEPPQGGTLARVAQLLSQVGQYEQANADGRFDSLICRLKNKIATILAQQVLDHDSSSTLDIQV